MAEGPVAEGELRDPPSRPKAPRGASRCGNPRDFGAQPPGSASARCARSPPPRSPVPPEAQLPAQHGVMQGGRAAAGPAHYETPQKHRGDTGRGSPMPPPPGPVPPHRAQLPPTGPSTPFRARYPPQGPPRYPETTGGLRGGSLLPPPPIPVPPHRARYTPPSAPGAPHLRC